MTRLKIGKTSDGKRIELHDDGSITLAHGFAINGVGDPRDKYKKRIYRDVSWMIFDELQLFDLSEVSLVIHAARDFAIKHFAASGDTSIEPGNMRYEMAKAVCEATP